MDMDAIPPEVLADLTIYNMPPSPPLFDSVGIFYMCFGSIWTAIVLSGMIFCWFNRKSPVLRHRGLPLSMAAITLLHIYWCLAQIVYPVGRTLPTVLAYDIQYFAMGIYFPLGIALFQAANSRFLHVAKLQKQYVHGGFTRTKRHSGCNGAQTSWLCRLRNMAYINKIMIFIGIGMIFQCALTVGMWFACAKYHPTYGIPGTHIKGNTFPEQLIDLGRGWEWWPSVVWQVIWTWMVAPYLLWRAWGIRDTMGWRAQTIGCCISGLHATPMFLISSYVPAFYPVNVYYPPSQWIHLSVMMIEIFTIFVPTYQVIRLKIQAKRAAASNDKWDTASETTLRTSTSTEWKKTSLGDAEKGQSVESFESSDRLLTMSALDHVLTTNPSPLQEFSALSDFSGENIAFLTRVSSWKSSWPVATDDETMLDLYNQALAIYIDFISPRDAQFPLNISSKTLVHLQSIFEDATRTLLGEGSQNAATPFDFAPPPSPSGASDPSTLLDKAQFAGSIPEGFGRVVFDVVESHIKYLVLTNTWPKFVEMQARRSSVESERSGFSQESGKTLASKVSSTVGKIGRTLGIGY